MNHNPVLGAVKAIGQSNIVITGRVVTSTNGTIASQTSQGGGVTVTKTGGQTGRYTFQLAAALDVPVTSMKLLHASATVIGPDTAALTTTKGLVAVLRADDVGQNNNDGTFELQWVQTNAGNADTDVQDAASFTFMIVLGNISVVG